MRKIHASLILVFLLTTCKIAFAYDFSYDPFAEATVNLGIRDYYSPIDYDDDDRFHSYDSMYGTNPSVSVAGSISPISSDGFNVGVFSGSASASAQNLTGKISMPAIPDSWTADIYNFSLNNSARASYSDYLYYPGTGEGELTLHFDITGSVSFSNTSYTGDPMTVGVQMSILDPILNTASYESIFENSSLHQWVGGNFYSNHDINYGFDYTVGIQLGEENNMWSEFLVYASFEGAGAPAITMDFSNTATFYAKELRNAIGEELPLIDPSSGVSLLESASGTNYATPIPGAVWLLGSGLLGLIGIRRKLKK